MPSNHDERPLIPMTARQQRAMRQAQMSRRTFLQRSGGLPVAAAGSVALAGGVAGVASQDTATPTPEEPWPMFEGVPETPHSPVMSDNFVALTALEAATVEALTARILPGSPEDPGAREAGVVYYIDYLLSQNDGIQEHTYRVGPWARAYEGDEEPEPEEGVVWVPVDELERYGWQSPLTPLEIYQIGLEALDTYANETYGGSIPDLSEDDQDQIIWDMLDEEIDQFEAFSSISFFKTLRMHTAEGMFSDPGYGGNRDLIGWQLVGFPGAQRSYSPEELVTEAEPREPQSMHDLPEFNPGRTEDGPVLPVRGTDPDDSDGQ